MTDLKSLPLKLLSQEQRCWLCVTDFQELFQGYLFTLLSGEEKKNIVTIYVTPIKQIMEKS